MTTFGTIVIIDIAIRFQIKHCLCPSKGELYLCFVGAHDLVLTRGMQLFCEFSEMISLEGVCIVCWRLLADFGFLLGAQCLRYPLYQ